MSKMAGKAMQAMAANGAAEVFVWDARLETGIAALDQQHRKLVGLVNALSRIPLDESTLAEKRRDLLAILMELENYVQYHFGFEARLMREAQLGPDLIAEHIEAHKKEHGEFMEQVTEASVLAQNWPLEAVAGMRHFLSYWLQEHIVGMDFVMAGCVGRAIRT